MRKLRPTFVTWSDARETTLPADIPVQMIGGEFPYPNSLKGKVLRRAGTSLAYRLSDRNRSLIWQALEPFDAVLCHFAWTAIPVAQAISGRRPLIVHVHGRDVSAQLEMKSYRNALARLLPKTDLLVAVGKHQVERLRPIGRPRRSVVIPCGAPITELAEVPVAMHSGDKVTIISVGRISEEKGILQTLDAFELLAGDRPNVHLRMIGDGPLINVARLRVAQSAFADRIDLPGRMPPEQVAQALSEAQIFTQHSLEINGWLEGFGVSVTEAGAVGLPLVLSASGGLLDQLEEGVNGLSFQPLDVSGQARALARLADSHSLREQYGKAARRLAMRFETSEMVAALEGEILCAIASQEARP